MQRDQTHTVYFLKSQRKKSHVAAAAKEEMCKAATAPGSLSIAAVLCTPGHAVLQLTQPGDTAQNAPIPSQNREPTATSSLSSCLRTK